MKFENMHKAVWIAPVAFLVLAYAPLPYGYYTLLRLVVTIAAGLLVVGESSKSGWTPWAFVFVGVALLFNPLIPIHLDRDAWAVLDAVVIILFGTHFIATIRYLKAQQ